MCSPVAVGVAMLASTAVSAYSQQQQSKYQSSLANYNADVQEKSANAAINAGNEQAAQQRQRARQLSGTQAATLAANGVDISSGTSLDVFGDTAQQGELDALTTVNNAQRQAYGLQAEAAASRSQASASSSLGNLQVGSTLLNGLTSSYMGYTKAGGSFGSLFGSGTSNTATAFDSLKTSSYGSNSFTF